jgi:hypothetical protein
LDQSAKEAISETSNTLCNPDFWLVQSVEATFGSSTGDDL